MSPEELYEATRGVWRLDPKRAHAARLVLAVVKGEVVEAYEVHRWEPAGTTPYRFRTRREIDRAGRYEFVGAVSDEGRRRYVGQRVDGYLRKGNQNPIRYVAAAAFD
jgi:hypothetical protein